jgi:monoamine oxidase
VVVIGAGLSGLVSARILNNTGFQVVVLEARGRIGGRIWTDDSLGIPCDLGASWIHGAKKNPLTRWCRNLGIELVFSHRERNRFYENGLSRKFGEQLWLARRGLAKAGCSLAKALTRLRVRRFVDHDKDQSIGSVFSSLLTDSELRAVDRRVLSWLLAMVESIYGAPAEDLSLLEVDPVEMRMTNAIPLGGFEQLIHDAASGLDIKLKSEVKTIDRHGDGFTIQCEEGAFSADLVVVAVPLGVLKSTGIRFMPDLPMEKQNAISRIGHGGRAVLNKIALRFPERFWPKEYEMLSVLPENAERRGALPVWTNLEPTVGAPVIVGFMSGTLGAAWDLHASDTKIKDRALEVLDRMFPARLLEPEAYAITRWLSDPWSIGSYSYRAVGSRHGDREKLSEPIADTLFFAGEATHESLFSMVDGALMAGEREARRIHRRYCCDAEEIDHLPWRGA